MALLVLNVAQFRTRNEHSRNCKAGHWDQGLDGRPAGRSAESNDKRAGEVELLDDEVQLRSQTITREPPSSRYICQT